MPPNMVGRTRRTRILLLVLLSVIAFVLYTRNTVPVDDYRKYFQDKATGGVGGGAVLRPDKQSAQPPYTPPKLSEQAAEKAKENNPYDPSKAPERPPPPPLQEPKPQPPAPKPDPPAPAKPKPSTTNPEAAAKTDDIDDTDDTDDVSSDLNPPSQPLPIGDDELPYEIGQGRVEVPVVQNTLTTAMHWSKMPEHFPVSTTIQLPTGSSVPLPRIQRATKKLAAAGADKERLAYVKAATEHAWKGYKEFAFGMDEVKPISGRVNNPFNGWGATMVDALDTLWIAGMKEEFEEAVEAVGKIDFTTSVRPDIPIFETTIRYLGGLVAAYDVAGRKHRILLDKAVELAEVMFTIFDTPNRMPQTYFRWKPAFASQPHRAATRVILAEIGTLSLEFTRLAQLTHEPKYYDAVARITDAFEEWQNNTRIPGMWPTSFDASGCNKTATRLKEDAMMPIGDDGHYMTTTDPVKVDSDSQLQKDPYALKVGLRNSADLGGTVPGKPGVGKIQGWDDTHKEGAVPEPNIKEKLLSEELGSSKRKRDVDSAESLAPPDKRVPTPGLEECVIQGLASTNGMSQETFTLSGASDSMYEYLPKEFLLLGGQVEQYRSMYLASAETAIQKLVYKPMTKDQRDILMVGEIKSSPNYSQPGAYLERFKPEAAHLACFAGGMFAMGGVIFNKPEHVEIGSKLTEGCVWAYNSTATGIMPEGAELMPCPDPWGACPWDEAAYWDMLDPYWKARTEVVTPVTVIPTNEGHPDPDPVGPRRPGASSDASEDVSEAIDNLIRRQLGDLRDEDAAPAAPKPAAAPIAPHLPDLPDLPQLPQTSKKPSASLPAYPRPADSDPIPEPTPLSHEEYVASKISEERLPPGFVRINHRSYILRPEAIESVFYMYRITGDVHWRNVGWDMFTAIERHTRALHGHSAIDDITKAAPEQLDQEESFWLAETLKYFYLLYDEPQKWSLDDWVLNTEAHLFRRPEGKVLEDGFGGV